MYQEQYQEQTCTIPEWEWQTTVILSMASTAHAAIVRFVNL